jgi:polyribonucleotide nucleotidyltransferase
LIGRLIDRSIRPLFPKEFKRDVQVVITVLSVDGENEPDILAINAVSAALAISPIPWKGPIGAVRVGYVKEQENGNFEYLINPKTSEATFSELDIVVSQTQEKTHMIEASGLQVPEEVVLNACKNAHVHTAQIIKLIEDLTKQVGQTKLEVEKNPKIEEYAELIKKQYSKEVASLVASLADKESGGGEFDALVDKIFDELKSKDPELEIDKKTLSSSLEKVVYLKIREDAVKNKKRPDGRKIDEIRELTASTGILPRTHGSAIFQRGITQALTVVTLGSPRMEQLIESAEGEESKRYIHHYSMPPYSVGETGRMFGPSRREIGHGALAERALEPVIPTSDKFPYTIRVVSEILSSNGSTSMASTCGSTLALMDAGVPILKPVGGISIGMMSIDEDYVLLTDILGLEDFSGDMDFKVAGTDTGITAIQLDVKILGLTDNQIEEILEAAKVARTQILDVINKTIPHSREDVSVYAPKIEQVSIPVDKIGEVIGPSGKIIKNIIAQTGATVDVEDDGTVTFTATDESALNQAVDWVKGIVKEVVAGEVYEGEVKRILPFGAFVEITKGKEGMVHVSKMGKGFVSSPEEVVQIGDKVTVRVIEIDDQGRINLSMNLDPASDEDKKDRKPRFNDRDRGGRGHYDRNDSSSQHPLSRQFKRERSGSSQRPSYSKRRSPR